MFNVNVQLINYAAHEAVGAEACVTKTYERRVSCICLGITLGGKKKKKTDTFLQNLSPWQQQTPSKKVQCKGPKVETKI